MAISPELLIDVPLVTEFLNVFNKCEGIISISDVVQEFQHDQVSFSQAQIEGIDRLVDAMMYLGWVLSALENCEAEIRVRFDSFSSKRKDRPEPGKQIDLM